MKMDSTTFAKAMVDKIMRKYKRDMVVLGMTEKLPLAY